MQSLAIADVVSRVAEGRIRIPAFQRGFVWDREQVAYFVDSLYKGYPFGTALLWRTRRRLRSERALGPFELPEPADGMPVDYVLDGQQRLTVIFGVFNPARAKVQDDDTFDVYFDLDAAPTDQGLQFRWSDGADAADAALFPLRALLDPVVYAQRVRALPEAAAEAVHALHQRMTSCVVPTQAFESDEPTRVAIVFERINRLGVELDTMQLLSAWTWSEEFSLRERFEQLAERLGPAGFGGIADDMNLLLRCCGAVVCGRVATQTLIALEGGQVRRRFDDVEGAVAAAIDFLHRNLGVRTIHSLPYRNLIVPLAAFFSEPGRESCSDMQRRTLLRWFWRACFSARYATDAVRKLEHDVREALQLRVAPEDSRLDAIEVEIEPDMFLARFNPGAARTRAFLLLLVQHGPCTFISGTPVELGPALTHGNRSECHHCFPQAHLRKQGRERADIDVLANIALMTSIDNKLIADAPPSVYRMQMPPGAEAEILTRAVCPPSLFDDQYENFLEDRADMLARAARAVCDYGEIPRMPDPADLLGA